MVRTHGGQSVIGDGAPSDPSRTAAGHRFWADGKLGAFVETKNSTIGAGTKVPHLTYVGDADIGEHSNIGASSVFVNYDGVNKSRTTIGSHVRTGSDTMFVAPVTVGDGAYTGAGTSCAKMCRPVHWQCRRARSATSRAGSSESGPDQLGREAAHIARVDPSGAPRGRVTGRLPLAIW